MLEDSANITKEYFVFHRRRIENYGLLSGMDPIKTVTEYSRA